PWMAAARFADTSGYNLDPDRDMHRWRDWAFYPTNASNPSTVRSWNDANRDFIVQGDPLNPVANGELGPSSNRNFGQTIFTTTLDPSFATGYDKRPYNWDVSAGVQHQLLPQVSVSAMFYRRWFGNC